MNFYNPYFYSLPTVTQAASSGGLLSRLSFSSLLNGTTKALNFANQAIPVVKQISPIFKNMKTMFKVMNEFKKNDTSLPEETPSLENSFHEKSYRNETNGPTFFI